jgi:hypothetical protein
MFSQLPLTVLAIVLPHVIKVEVIGICEGITVYVPEILHPAISYVA